MATIDWKTLGKQLAASPGFKQYIEQRALRMRPFSSTPEPPLPWYARLWCDVRWRVGMARVWLGELIAGRSFDDHY